MQEAGSISAHGEKSRKARVILVIFLLVAVSGIWACLWVPPAPLF